jgi:hypothetical protein
MKPNIFEKFEDGWGYNEFNYPAWKHLNENGHTIVRGLSPRINVPFIHIFLENCREKINCFEITETNYKRNGLIMNKKENKSILSVASMKHGEVNVKNLQLRMVCVKNMLI